MNIAILMAAVGAAAVISLSSAAIAQEDLHVGNAQKTSTADDHALIGVIYAPTDLAIRVLGEGR